MQEIWKTIEGYNNYEISSYGRVKSLERLVSNGIIKCRKNEEKIMKPQIIHGGYYGVKLSNNGKKKAFKVHRLVALHFIENPENKAQVNHIDFDRTNANVENLEWTTCQENVTHSVKARRYKGNVSNKSRWGRPKKKAIGINVRNGYVILLNSISEGRNYGFYQSHISNVCRGDKKTTKGYAFNYL